MKFTYRRSDGREVVYATRADRTLRRRGLVTAEDYYRDGDGFGVQRTVLTDALRYPGWTMLTLYVQTTPTKAAEFHAFRETVQACYDSDLHLIAWRDHGEQVLVPRRSFQTRAGLVCPVPSRPKRKPDPAEAGKGKPEPPPGPVEPPTLF